MSLQVLLIRHATAETLPSQPDKSRALTETGKADMQQYVGTVKNFVDKIDCLASSPLLRAVQTADIVHQTYSMATRNILPSLADGQLATILTYLQENAGKYKTIALVGHEPSLGELSTWLLTAQAGNWMPLKKGGMCLLNFNTAIEAGHATISWLLTPKIMR